MPLSKDVLSGSTHGKGILVSQTAIATGDTIHTAQATTTAGQGDEIVLYAYNSDASAVVLTIGWGGTTDPDDLVTRSIPSGGYELVIPGRLLRNGLVVKASAGTANKIVVDGYIVRSS